MATRNRTVAFMKYREAVRQTRPAFSTTVEMGDMSNRLVQTANSHKGGGYNSLSTYDADAGTRAAIAPSLPPAWVDISEEVSAEMAKLRSKLAELIKAHSRALMPSFDDSGGAEKDIEVLTQEITRMFKRCEQKLQRLSSVGGGGDEDGKIRKNVQRSLATDLQQLSLDFRKQQKGYLAKLRRMQEGPSTGLNVSLERKEPDDDELYDPGFNEQQLHRVKHSEAAAQEREKEIQQIVESVAELAQIMKDLSVLVIDQGTIVDRIDYNIEQVSASIEKGVEQLVKAEKHQKAGRMVLCIMLLVVLCLLMIVVLVLKHLFL